MRTEIKNGDIVRRYDGQLFVVLSMNTENTGDNGTKMAVYMDLKSGKKYCEPKEVFLNRKSPEERVQKFFYENAETKEIPQMSYDEMDRQQQIHGQVKGIARIKLDDYLMMDTMIPAVSEMVTGNMAGLSHPEIKVVAAGPGGEIFVMVTGYAGDYLRRLEKANHEAVLDMQPEIGKKYRINLKKMYKYGVRKTTDGFLIKEDDDGYILYDTRYGVTLCHDGDECLLIGVSAGDARYLFSGAHEDDYDIEEPRTFFMLTRFEAAEAVFSLSS